MPRPFRRRPAAAIAHRFGAAVSIASALLVVAPAAADPPPETSAAPASGLEAALEAQVRRLALDGSRSVTLPNGAQARIEVLVGQLDPRLRLAPCARIEPYLPDGTRPWGRTRIGLRCLEGAVRWNVYLPITVKVWGPGLVATAGGASGSTLAAADLALAEVDLAEDASPALVDPAAALGRTLARGLKPGQSVRVSHLKARQWFGAGDTVTVVAQGEGYAVSGEAQALTPGIEGQPVRVRTESGKILTGLPTADRRVELAL